MEDGPAADYEPYPFEVDEARMMAEVERRFSVVEELEAAVIADLQRATHLRQSVLHKSFLIQPLHSDRE